MLALPDIEKQVVLMHFGFIDGEVMTQREIASVFGLSQSYVSRIIRKALENSNAKIIMLTSHVGENEVMESLRAGVNAYVLKDINSDMLAMVLRSVNDGAMWLDPKVVPIIRESGSTVIPAKTKNRANFKATHSNLTEREYEVLKLVVDGKSNYEIAQILKISEHTSKAHVCNIIQKLVVDDRTQAAVKALKEGLV